MLWQGHSQLRNLVLTSQGRPPVSERLCGGLLRLIRRWSWQVAQYMPPLPSVHAGRLLRNQSGWIRNWKKGPRVGCTVHTVQDVVVHNVCSWLEANEHVSCHKEWNNASPRQMLARVDRRCTLVMVMLRSDTSSRGGVLDVFYICLDSRFTIERLAPVWNFKRILPKNYKQLPQNEIKFWSTNKTMFLILLKFKWSWVVYHRSTSCNF